MTEPYRELQFQPPNPETIQNLYTQLETLVSKNPKNLTSLKLSDYPELVRTPMFGLTVKGVVSAGRGAGYLITIDNSNQLIYVLLNPRENKTGKKDLGYLHFIDLDENFNYFDRTYYIYNDRVLKYLRYYTADELDKMTAEDFLEDANTQAKTDKEEAKIGILSMSEDEMEELIEEVNGLLE